MDCLSTLELTDLNLQDKGFELLKRRNENFREKANGSESSTKGFESPRRNLKQKVKKRKEFESPLGGSKSIIWENKKQR